MRLAAVIAIVGGLVAGCGYVDDNGRAAAVVAQVYLDGYATKDAAAICRVLAPHLQQAEALVTSQPTCDAGVETELKRTYPHLTVGRTRSAGESPRGNPQMLVQVVERSGYWITLERYASIWRVVLGAPAAAT